MRKACLLLLFLFLSFWVYAGNVPSPVGWVNDFAGVISPEYREKLAVLIEELEQKTTAEIGIVTIESITPYDEKEYARLLFDNWKPGKKGKDNGVLVLLAVKERRWRIETGYGIEGILPDGLCGEIARNYMVPYFKEGKYSEGLYQGALKIAQVIAKDANVKLSALGDLQERTFEKNISSNSIMPILILLFMGFIIFTNYLSYKQRKNGHYYGGWGYGGGSWGGGGGGFGGGGFGGGGGGGGGAGGGF